MSHVVENFFIDKKNEFYSIFLYGSKVYHSRTISHFVLRIVCFIQRTVFYIHKNNYCLLSN